MRYAIISDIHSNIDALNAVLAHIRKRGIKEIICLGDIIGYGPNPIECMQLVMDNCSVCLKGNHDEGLVEGIYLFNTIAKGALEWTKKVFVNLEQPTKDQMWSFLQELPLIYSVDRNVFVHGSPLDPTSDYILARNVCVDEKKFADIFATFDKILFSGHTHMPCVITESLEVLSLKELGYKYHLGDEKVIINVGSVGQPRDEDTRACYLEVIDDMFFFHRIIYDVDLVYKKIMDNKNLNNALGKRLREGK